MALTNAGVDGSFKILLIWLPSFLAQLREVTPNDKLSCAAESASPILSPSERTDSEATLGVSFSAMLAGHPQEITTDEAIHNHL